MAAEYGHQPQRVIEEAQRRPSVELQPEESQRVAQVAVSYARERGTEREAVVDERTLMRDALKHSMGAARLPEIKAEFERRVAARELIEVERRPGLAGRAFTTGEMQGYEREIVERMRAGQGNREVLADGQSPAAGRGEPSTSEHEPASGSRRRARKPRPDDGS